MVRKDSDQTYQIPIPILIEPLLGILSVVSGESLPAYFGPDLGLKVLQILPAYEK